MVTDTTGDLCFFVNTDYSNSSYSQTYIVCFLIVNGLISYSFYIHTFRRKFGYTVIGPVRQSVRQSISQLVHISS